MLDVQQSPAWTPRLSSHRNPRYGHAILRSNRWPGAFAVAKDDRYTLKKTHVHLPKPKLTFFVRRFANLYVGYGYKHTGQPFTPELPPAPVQPVERLLQQDKTPQTEREEEKALVAKLEAEAAEDEVDEEEEEEEDEDE